MKKATFVTASYEESDTITHQGTRSSIQRYISKGYTIKQARNGFWILVKPTYIHVYLKNSNNITFSFNMKKEILDYYGKTRISIKIFNDFVQDASSGRIQFYMDDDNSYYFK